MRRILYIHGLGGGANGRIPSILREQLGDEYIIDAPEIPIKPEEAMAFITHTVESNDYDMAIGSSLGAFYLMKSCPGLRKILLNPAVEAGHYIEKFIGLGEHDFRSSRKDGSKTYIIDKNFIAFLKELELFHDDEEECYMKCFVSPEDDLFGPVNATNCRKYFLEENIVLISGGHSVDEATVKEKVIPEIENFMTSELWLPPIYMYGLDSRYMDPKMFED